MHRIKEVYRGDPVTMHIYSPTTWVREERRIYLVKHRDRIETSPTALCEECNSELHPVHYVNRVKGEEQYFTKERFCISANTHPVGCMDFTNHNTMEHVTTLIAMENYVNSSYTKARMPRVVSSSDREYRFDEVIWRSVKRRWRKTHTSSL